MPIRADTMSVFLVTTIKNWYNPAKFHAVMCQFFIFYILSFRFFFYRMPYSIILPIRKIAFDLLKLFPLRRSLLFSSNFSLWKSLLIFSNFSSQENRFWSSQTFSTQEIAFDLLKLFPLRKTGFDLLKLFPPQENRILISSNFSAVRSASSFLPWKCTTYVHLPYGSILLIRLRLIM